MMALPAWQGLRRLCGRGGLVVVAPHPDDEVLGCGGVIAAAAARCISVHVVLATDGGASHPEAPRARLAAMRLREIRAALRRLGGARLWSMGVPDGASGAAAGGLERGTARLWLLLRLLLRRLRPRAVLAPPRQDTHPDHRAACAMASRAIRRSPVLLAEYAMWGPMDGGRMLPVRVGAQTRRRAAWACHVSQLGRAPGGFGAGFALPPGHLAMTRRPREIFRLERAS